MTLEVMKDSRIKAQGTVTVVREVGGQIPVYNGAKRCEIAKIAPA